ncbi:MAG: hypothetical protein FJ405_06765 [Verrucomicrobia bacterium]|nr:hypothetical protein [Verrucomicrobiota bacterium]
MRTERAEGSTFEPTALVLPNVSLMHGWVRLDAVTGMDLEATALRALTPLETSFLPEELKTVAQEGRRTVMAFRFQGTPWAMNIKAADSDPEANRVIARGCVLEGEISGENAFFSLKGEAVIKSSRGGRLKLLAGSAALVDWNNDQGWKLEHSDGAYHAVFSTNGVFPVLLRFHVRIEQREGWRQLAFQIPPSPLATAVLRGLPDGTQLNLVEGSAPSKTAGAITTVLPSDGSVRFSWKPVRASEEGKLFYAADLFSQVITGPGWMRQESRVVGKVTQGELRTLELELRGAGQVSRVTGSHILSWRENSGGASTNRTLVIEFNQPMRDVFNVQVHLQQELGALPATARVMELTPRDAMRINGFVRVVNEGAVRLEVLHVRNASQISPDQLPADLMPGLREVRSTQQFAFRFANTGVALELQADHILPEVSASAVLQYHFGETGTSIQSELELDIREAPLRELLLQIPKGYMVSKLTGANVSEFLVIDGPSNETSTLRILWSVAAIGRHEIQFKLEALGATTNSTWTLPRIVPQQAKTLRGFVSVSADSGFRLAQTRVQGLTEVAAAFFPKKIVGLQSGYRIIETGWEAVFGVERLPQSIQAEVLHLFSIAEGIAYGSSTVNCLISGAPVTSLQFGLSAEYFNVEFTGRDVRSWQKTTNGYRVQFHSPVSGSCTLLAAYERPFRAQGETLGFTGVQLLDATTEMGHTLIISAGQFEVKPVSVSAGLLPLESAEVPAEHRLLFDAPLLGAYRYPMRPFDLQLAISPLEQTETLSLAVDRAVLNTRISKDGEVVTDVRYVVKNRGNTHLSMNIPETSQLWSITVNGTPAAPVREGRTYLIPLPQRTDPNASLVVEVKLGTSAAGRDRIQLVAPAVGAPILMTDWNLIPDEGRRLIHRAGSIPPEKQAGHLNGFAAIQNLLVSHRSPEAVGCVLLVLGFMAVGGLVAAWGSRSHSRARWARCICILAALAGGAGIGGLAILTSDAATSNNRGIQYLAPVQPAGASLAADVIHTESRFAPMEAQGAIVPLIGLLFALYAWKLSTSTRARSFAEAAAWMSLAWAGLGVSAKGVPFFIVLGAFFLVRIGRPWFLRLSSVSPETPASNLAGSSVAGATTLLSACLLSSAAALSAQAGEVDLVGARSLKANRVEQTGRVVEGRLWMTAKIEWDAKTMSMLPILDSPAVLTGVRWIQGKGQHLQIQAADLRTHLLRAEAEGKVVVEYDYELPTQPATDGLGSFVLPSWPGLANTLELSIPGSEVQVIAVDAASTVHEFKNSSTRAKLSLPPVKGTRILWKPRSRDVATEHPVFFAETSDVFVPGAGVLEGFHVIQVRPAQGEVNELILETPEHFSITDVLEIKGSNVVSSADRSQVNRIASWRFDPIQRRLRITFHVPSARPIEVAVRSQLPSGSLPSRNRVAPLSVLGATNQMGSVGVLTGAEVQLDDVTPDGMVLINLEDFPPGVVSRYSGASTPLTLRKAFRYSGTKGALAVSASQVEPYLTTETEQTLSMGEDRTLLAVQLRAFITRAGMFRISFPIPAGLEVESVSGTALSHWTESRQTGERIASIHFKARTEGEAKFSITLSGLGIKPTKQWTVPRFAVREANKSSGQLLIVPEQGLRAQVLARQGAVQQDPKTAGVRHKGALSFRLLQADWSVQLDLEQVEAWVQILGLQHASVREGQVKMHANLQYQIENTGLKSLRVRVAADASGVAFRGDHVGDAQVVAGTLQAGFQTWEVKLHQRVIGKYQLQVSYSVPVAQGASQLSIAGVQGVDANLQRGFLTVEAKGRQRVTVQTLPSALQVTDRQSIPPALLENLSGVNADYAYRVVEPGFVLGVTLERHEAAKVQPAQVQSVSLVSIVSDPGTMLTETRMELRPGDKRALKVTLPEGARFWNAFVNQKPVWPWREGGSVMIPLEAPAQSGGFATVEFSYSSASPSSAGESLDLHGPKFDLPLEGIEWRVYLSGHRRLVSWDGTLQLQTQGGSASRWAGDVDDYLKLERAQQEAQTRKAEELLKLGNERLAGGDPRLARRAFESAYQLSSHDIAFNEDARVQLHNLKLQQALLGLNAQQAQSSGGRDSAALEELRRRRDGAYTQEQAKEILDGRSADESAALTRLAERLIQQQDAAAPLPAAIRSSLPLSGHVLTFRRSVQAEVGSEMRLSLETRLKTRVHWLSQTLALAGMLAVFAGLIFRARAYSAR